MKDSIIDRLNLFTLGEKKENAYQKFFKGKLKEWEVSSPEDLSDEDKKKFFAEVKKEWASKG